MIKRTSALIFILTLVGCADYSDYYLYPNEDFFQVGRNPKFINPATMEIVPLRNQSYACYESSIFDSRTDYRTYNRYHLHQCAELMKVHPSIEHQLDHTIRSVAVFRYDDERDLNFSGASFRIPIESDSLELRTIIFQHSGTSHLVYSLSAEVNKEFSKVDSIFYSPVDGLMMIKCKNGSVWERHQ